MKSAHLIDFIHYLLPNAEFQALAMWERVVWKSIRRSATVHPTRVQCFNDQLMTLDKSYTVEPIEKPGQPGEWYRVKVPGVMWDIDAMDQRYTERLLEWADDNFPEENFATYFQFNKEMISANSLGFELFKELGRGLEEGLSEVNFGCMTEGDYYRNRLYDIKVRSSGISLKLECLHPVPSMSAKFRLYSMKFPELYRDNEVDTLESLAAKEG